MLPNMGIKLCITFSCYEIYDPCDTRICYFRFTVAIKHPHAKTDGNFDTEEMQMFLEEAKSMLEIGEYHENIVNLQGVIYGHEDIQKGLPKVSF